MDAGTVLTITSNSVSGLHDKEEKLITFLEKNQEELDIYSLVSKLNDSSKKPHKLAVVAQNIPDLLQKLKTKKYLSSSGSNTRTKIVYLFPGQGSQFPGMGRNLYKAYPTFRETFDYCSKKLLEFYPEIDLKTVLFSDTNPEEIQRSLYSQCGIFVVEYSLCKLLEEFGVKADILMGHSLGEYAAATVAGLIELDDALELMGKRCTFVETLPEGRMLALSAGEEKTKQLMHEFIPEETDDNWLELAAISSPFQTAVSGPTESVLRFQRFCKERKTATILVDSKHAYHTKVFDGILKEFQILESSIDQTKKETKAGNDADTPFPTFISGLDGNVKATLFGNYWTRNLRKDVQFSKAFQTLQGIVKIGNEVVFLEVGPQPFLSANIPRDAVCIPVMKKLEVNRSSSVSETENFLQALAKLFIHGVDINWQLLIESQQSFDEKCNCSIPEELYE